jgi:hypothetical protein
LTYLIGFLFGLATVAVFYERTFRRYIKLNYSVLPAEDRWERGREEGTGATKNKY